MAGGELVLEASEDELAALVDVLEPDESEDVLELAVEDSLVEDSLVEDPDLLEVEVLRRLSVL